MEDYRLEQSGQQVQDILNGAAMQSDLTAENERAELAEQTLDGKIDDEETRAKGVEGTLQENIDAEETRAKAAEKTNADDIDALEAAIQAILLLIPSAATSLNKLTDKAYVDSSIATASATFRGTYNEVTDLELTTEATHSEIAAALADAVSGEDNNDYAFVQIPTSDETPTQIAKTERYKFNGTSWEYEYDLNNSGYTSEQWAAINSGITAALVEKLSALPTNANLTAALGVLTDGIAAINEKIPSGATSSNKMVDTAAMESYIGQIIDALDATFNITSTDGHVTVQISQVNGEITSVSVTTSDIASDADLNLLAGRVATAEGNISTNADDIAALQDAYAALTQSAPQIIAPTDTWPVANPSTTVIYRVVDRVNTPPQYYSDYMWNGTTMVLMAQYNNAIDSRPKKDSQNLVTSGGVFDNMGALDVSELNATENPHTLATYADLSAALAAIPSDYQKGGMSIKFVHTSDNKYVQYRLLTQSFSINENDWIGLRKNPDKSPNLFDKYVVVHGYYGDNGITYRESDKYWCSDFIEVEEGQLYERNIGVKSLFVYAYDIDKQPVVVEDNHVYWQTNFESTPIPSGVKYIRVLFTPSYIDVEMVYNQSLRPTEYVEYTAPFILDNKIDIVLKNLAMINSADNPNSQIQLSLVQKQTLNNVESYKNLANFLIPNATKIQTGLLGAADKKKLDSLRTSSLSILTFNAETAFTLDFTAKTLSVNAGILIVSGNELIINRAAINTYTTEFIGIASPERLSYIVYHIEDNKLYLIDYQSISSYPEYNSQGNIINIYLGPINKMSPTNDYWSIGFNYGHIVIDGKDYYGNYTPDSVFPITPVDTNFIENVITGINLFNKLSVVHGYYGDNGITYRESDKYWCSDFIEVEEGQLYERNIGVKSLFVYAYDIDKQPVVVEDNHVYWQTNFESTPIPSGVKYIRVLFTPSYIDVEMVYNQSLRPTEYVPYSYYQLDNDIHVNLPKIDDYTPISNNIGTSDVGNLSYQEIDETDYSQIIMYGQSLSMGWEAPEAITENAISGVFMVGDKVSIGHGNNGQNVLNPLISTMATSCGENPTVGAMNAFAKLYKRFVSKEQKFIATSCGEGGKSIEQLSKECTNGTNYYNTQFITTLTRTKATVDSENKTVGCFAILFMQGEYNYKNLQNGGLTPGTDATNDKDTYKQYLLTLKNNMQADIMAQYGQSKKPLFFLYEVAGSYINLKNMSINMAQIEFAQENDDVFLLAPTYPVPDYSGGHLSTNGYRWYGEMMAKSLYNIFIKGLSFYSIMPEKFEVVNDSTIRIDFHVPVLPLIFDTYTKESIQDYGFSLFVDNTATAISSLTIKNNSVIIKTESSLTSKKIELTYAGQGRSGSGNLRDSDTYHSLYNYYDDRETSPSKRENYTPKDKNGNYIYGKSYPMFNWCGNFYKLVQESNN